MARCICTTKRKRFAGAAFLPLGSGVGCKVALALVGFERSGSAAERFLRRAIASRVRRRTAASPAHLRIAQRKGSRRVELPCLDRVELDRLAVSLAIAAAGVEAFSRGSGGFYDAGVYGMTPRTHAALRRSPAWRSPSFSPAHRLAAWETIAGVAGVGALCGRGDILCRPRSFAERPMRMIEFRFSPRPNRASEIGWMAVGRPSLRARPRRGQADSALDFGRLVPLVPRDGRNVVFRPRGDRRRSTSASFRSGSTTTGGPTSTRATTWAAGRRRHFSRPTERC